MSAVVLSGDTSGQISVEPPAVAGNNTLTLPAVTGTLSVLETSAYSVATLAALKALTTRPPVVVMSGYATADDGGEGLWQWVAGSAVTANDGTVVQCTSGAAGRYFRIYGDTIAPEWFGATGDGSTDDTTAFNAAVAACDNQSLLLNPKRTGYRFSINIGSASGCTGVISIGGKARVLEPPGSTLSTLILYVQRGDFTVENLFFDLPISTDPVVSPLANAAMRCDLATGSFVRFTNNRVSGGRTPVIFFGGGSACAYVTNNLFEEWWSDGTTVTVASDTFITDNIYRNGGYSNPAGAGAIRTASATGATAERLVIARNQISNSMVAGRQSSIDCYSGAARNIIISDNICDLNGAGIEIKTDNTVSPDNVYQSILVSNNIVRLLPAGAATVVGIALNATTTVPSTKPGKLFVTGNFVHQDAMAATGDGTYGISSTVAYEDTVISDNFVLNVNRGIDYNAIATTTLIQNALTIKNNTVKAREQALAVRNTNTLNGARILGNDLLSEVGRAMFLFGPVFNDLIVADNVMVAPANATGALDMADCRGASRVTGNTINAGVGYAIYLNTGAANTGLLIYNNDLTSGATHAVACGTGNTGIVVNDNNVAVGDAFRTVAGSGTFTTANNLRGTDTTTPVTAGSLNDVWANSAPSSGGALSWVCTTAGNAGAAVFTASILGSTVAVGTTTVTGGTSGRVLYNNAGVLGDLANTGTGNNVLATAPSLTTPAIVGTTWAGISAAGTAGRLTYVSDAGVAGNIFFDTGTRWKPMNGTATLKTLDTASSGIANTETIVFQYQLPVGLWQTGDRIRLYTTFNKSGTTDTGTLVVRVGTAGTTSDTSLISSTLLSAATRLVANIFEFRLESATSVQIIATPGGGYGNAAGTTVYPAAVAISSAAANALYVNVSIRSGGTTDTVSLADGQMVLVSKAS